MARQVLPIVGAVVGAYFGNPQLGYAIGLIIGNAVDPQVIKGPSLGEGQVNTAREGAYRPIVLGTGCVGCNIINVGPEIIRTKRDRQSKGGGPVTETKRRYRTFALRISEPVDALVRIWQSEKLVYDVRPESQITEDSVNYAEGFTFYNGSEDQLPDPDLEAYLGVGNVNAYRGTAYIVFKHFDLTDTQGSIPNFRFEVASSANATTPARVYAITVDNDGIVLGSDDGIVYDASYDSGLGADATRLFAAGGNIYAFAGNVGRVSQDGGLSWGDVSISGGGSFTQVNGIAYDRQTGTWCAVKNAGPIVRSSNGVNFVGTSTINRTRDAIACKDSVFVAVGTNRTVTVSFNSGLTWSEHTIPFYSGIASINSVVATETRFILVSGQGPFGVSTTGAPESWNEVDPGFVSPGTGAASLGHYGNMAVATCGGASVYSTNDGLTWTPGGTGPTSTVQKVIASNQNGFYLADRVTDDAVIWETSEEDPYYVAALDEATLPISAGLPIPLSSIISFIHQRCGHTSSQYDVGELTDLVDGVVFADGYTGGDAVKTLLPIYFADASEHDAGSGYKINYIKRGKPVVRTITIDDLVDEPDEAVRQDSLERPAKLHLHFQNPIIGYAAAKATSARTSPDVLVTGEVSVQVPVTFSDVNESWQIANKLHKIAWVEVAGTQELVLSEKDLDLVPTDNLGVYLRGQLIRYRMTSQAYADGMLKCEFMADRQSAVTSNVTGIELPEPPPPPTNIVGPTISAFLDIPALIDGHDALVAYAAATGQTPAWWGATYERSLDDGANYATATIFDGFNTIMGVLVDTVTAASPHYTDATNVVRVTLYTEDPIESLTQQQFLSEGGAFALSWDDGGERRWEILQYQSAEQDSGGDWLLSTLLRGRLNTEAAEHLAGALFVLLDNSVRVMAMQSAWLGMELTHRAVSNGETPESAVPYTDEFTGQSQTEWPVANLLLERDGDDIEATAVPRHRFGTDDAPVQSINHDGYRWTATDGVNTATADTDPPTHTFDVTGWSAPITVTVAQLNRITGAGPAVSEDIV